MRETLTYPVLYIFAAGIFSVISISPFSDVPYERTIFKLLTMSFLFAAVASSAIYNKKIRKSDFLLLYVILFFYFTLSVSDFINNSTSGLIPFLRFLSVSFVCLALFSMRQIELEKLLKCFLTFGFIVSVISLLFFITDFSRAERFPIINLYSNKSIIFEQNVFGIFIYMCLVISLSIPKKWLSSVCGFAIYLSGIFLSFYRTVYGLALIVIMGKIRVELKLVFLLSIFFIVLQNYELLSTIFKLEQIFTLTGRTQLWEIGYLGFADNPFFGLGESSISEFSNKVLHRDPPFTTFHNFFVDIIFSAGIFGLLSASILIILIYNMVGKGINSYILTFLLAPALFNTFYPFAPNILGLITGTWIMLKYRKSASKYKNNA